MTKKFVIVALVALVVGFGSGFLLKSNEGLGSVRYQVDEFTQGLKAGLNGEFRVADTGMVTAKEAIDTNTATTTLTVAQSGTTFYISGGALNNITLPAVANAGINYRFVIGGAVDTGNIVIGSAEGDNINGTLIVAGAVVDCRAEDFINFITDGEQLGDYVEVRSDGVQWFIGDSSVLTSAKMTCTDPS